MLTGIIFQANRVVILKRRKGLSITAYIGSSVFLERISSVLGQIKLINIQTDLIEMVIHSYHSWKQDAASNIKKIDILAWLSEENIPYDPRSSQPEFLDSARLSKPKNSLHWLNVTGNALVMFLWVCRLTSDIVIP